MTHPTVPDAIDPLRELRHDPIQRRWVIIASGRAERPVDGSQETWAPDAREKSCPFCEGHESLTPPEIVALRDGSPPDRPGWRVRVVPNKFPALRIEGSLLRRGHGQYDVINGIGAHEVIIETPEHDRELADLPVDGIADVLKVYRWRLDDLKHDGRFRYILVFKNHGRQAGATLVHSHSQLIATPVTPRTVAMELTSAREYYWVKERCIFCDLIEQERSEKTRIVLEDEHFITYCPYASRFSYEMTMTPKVHSHDFATVDDKTLDRAASHLKEVLRRMNIALERPPFNYVLHTAPNTTSGVRQPGYWSSLAYDWHWHIEILPRIQSVAGFEWGSGFYINPIAPEQAAERLRAAAHGETLG